MSSGLIWSAISFPCEEAHHDVSSVQFVPRSLYREHFFLVLGILFSIRYELYRMFLWENFSWPYLEFGNVLCYHVTLYTLNKPAKNCYYFKYYSECEKCDYPIYSGLIKSTLSRGGSSGSRKAILRMCTSMHKCTSEGLQLFKADINQPREKSTNMYKIR